MGGLLSSLNTPYTGLIGHQVMVDTTSNNIANASNEFYTRQMVHSSAQTPFLKSGGNVIGQGLEILSVERAHDEYTFMRYKKASMEKTFSETSFTALREASAYYPEVDKVGIYNDLQKYFNSWQDLSTRPGDPAQKEALISQAENLTHSIQETRARFKDLQMRLNDELKVIVDDVNRMGKEIAELNRRIVQYERQDLHQKANDLRDKRDEYEFKINELIGCNVFKENIQGSCVNKDIADFDDGYTLTIGGKSIVDEAGFHPLVVENDDNVGGIYTIKYMPSDHKPSDITNGLVDGKVGAILDLIRTHDVLTCNGEVGKLQKYIDDLDTFANGIIEATNNIYAESAKKYAISDKINLSANESLVGSGYNVREGSFDVVVYNKDGTALATRTIKIDGLTTMNEIVAQLNANIDDTPGDNDPLNDFDDKFEAVFDPMSGIFNIRAKNPAEDLTLSIQDKGTNFAGSFGINKFFDGKDASDIEVALEYRKDPTLIRAHREAVDGNKEVANKILQLQYDKVQFRGVDGIDREETINGYFRYITGIVASDTSSAKMSLETKTALHTSIKQEYKTISEVSVDEELVNLIRFQSGYSANAKIVTAIDEMINTLLGIK